MVRRVTIKNFKSIEDLSLDLGRCTILIGANGSGKSNILEAIALASAAASNKLDNEFLASRGIRVPASAEHISSAFKPLGALNPIEVIVSADRNQAGLVPNDFKCSIVAKQTGPYIELLNDRGSTALEDAVKATVPTIIKGSARMQKIDSLLTELSKEVPDIMTLPQLIYAALASSAHHVLKEFIVYSPEVETLRTFEREGQILPLGIRGAGLFRLVRSLLSQKDNSHGSQIKEALKAIDWFSDFSVPENLMSSEYTLRIRDRYLADDLAEFDQRSTNEGFLYLLFYFTLFCAEETPKFFALDNIDDSLNPRLSAETIKSLVNLAKQHDKQFIATTHQPGLLDGLDLSDPEQMLYVVFRNVEGRTAVKRVQPPKTNGSDPVRLSEAFIRGYLGGLPNHF